jgi:hypothetical protein
MAVLVGRTTSRIAAIHSGTLDRKCDSFGSLWREDMRQRGLSQPVAPA